MIHSNITKSNNNNATSKWLLRWVTVFCVEQQMTSSVDSQVSEEVAFYTLVQAMFTILLFPLLLLLLFE